MPGRYFVPDLTPMDRRELAGRKFGCVFVAESPHVSEVEATSPLERRPLCGAAGRVWWAALSETLGEPQLSELSATRLLGFCATHRIAVMNAVQVPLDPKIVERVDDPAADPLKTLGFSKELGSSHYKKAPAAARERALAALRRRLLDPALKGARIVALGNDADWFITHALSAEQLSERLYSKIAHPSAWWRRGGYYGKQARAALRRII